MDERGKQNGKVGGPDDFQSLGGNSHGTYVSLPQLVVPVTLVPRRLLQAVVVLVTLLEMKSLGMAMPARWLRNL